MRRLTPQTSTTILATYSPVLTATNRNVDQCRGVATWVRQGPSCIFATNKFNRPKMLLKQDRVARAMGGRSGQRVDYGPSKSSQVLVGSSWRMTADD